MGRLHDLQDVLDWRLCVGCGACVPACPSGGVRLVHVETEGYRPLLEAACEECGDCLDACPGAGVDANGLVLQAPTGTHSEIEFGPTLEIWEGWASDPEVRFRGSSGGALSALSLYCLSNGFDGVIHTGASGETPFATSSGISRTRAEVLERAGSRYAPSAPVAALADLPDDGTFVFVGKPCDTAAAVALAKREAALNRKLGVVLTFFCAGTPSADGTRRLVQELGVEQESVTSVKYRGDGWPGEFRVQTAADPGVKRLSYRESWGRLTAYRPLRCNLCPDGLGRVSDIACGDAWHRHDEGTDDPGRSIILVRTERGRRLLRSAVAAGYLTIRPCAPEDVLRAQESLLERRRALFGRLAGLRLLGIPTPRFVGFSLLRSWLATGVSQQARSVAGTVRRGWQRRWFVRQRRSRDTGGEK